MPTTRRGHSQSAIKPKSDRLDTRLIDRVIKRAIYSEGSRKENFSDIDTIKYDKLIESIANEREKQLESLIQSAPPYYDLDELKQKLETFRKERAEWEKNRE